MKLHEVKQPNDPQIRAIKDFMAKLNVGRKRFRINPDLTVDVTGSVVFRRSSSQGPLWDDVQLPVQFSIMTGDFSINSLTYLQTLKGCPKRVTGTLDVGGNPITSLEGCSTEVGVDFRCDTTSITSLRHGPQIVGRHFECDQNPALASLDGIASTIGGNLRMHNTGVKSLHNFHKLVKTVDGTIHLGYFGIRNLPAAQALPTHLLSLCLVQGIKTIETSVREFNNLFNRVYPDINLFQDGLIEIGLHEQAKL